MRRPRFLHLAAVTTAFVLSVTTTLSWAYTGGLDQLGVPYAGDPVLPVPPVVPTTSPAAGTAAAPEVPEPGDARRPVPSRTSPSSTATSAATPRRRGPAARPAPPAAVGGPRPATTGGPCETGPKLVPSCGVLWGVAPGAFTKQRPSVALAEFEKKTQRHQDIYHAYHRGQRQLFPTREEIAIAREKGRERVLLLNWKPAGVSWAKIAAGDPKTDRFLDRLAEHIRTTYPEQFFFTVHHEAEDNVREKAGSGYTAADFAAMYRHVVQRLRAHGAGNIVTVLVHMAYVPHTSQSWFNRMYPGDDVVDWIGFDTYAYSDPGYGHGDFAELLNRRQENKPAWPGFYNWAVARHPGKPLMIAEWGVWSSKRNPRHKAEFYREVADQIASFPNIRAMVHFDTPHNQKGLDSRVDATRDGLEAYRKLGKLPVFQVEVTHHLP